MSGRTLTYLTDGAEAGPSWASLPHVEVTVPATSANLGVGFDVMDSPSTSRPAST